MRWGTPPAQLAWHEASCEEMIEALERVGGSDALDLLTYDLDPLVQQIVVMALTL